MNDKMTGTVRTVVPAGWLALIVMVLNRVADWDLTLDELMPFLPIIMGGLGVFYRAARELEQRWPVIGRILFGSGKTPSYASGGTHGAEAPA